MTTSPDSPGAPDPHRGEKRAACWAFAAISVSILALITWEARPRTLGDPRPVHAAGEASPSLPDYAPQLSTLTALVMGTATAVPTATRPPDPTPTERPSCSSDTPIQAVCYGATVAPTLPPVNVAAPPTPYPIWPGEAMQTPGAAYTMGSN